MGSSIFTTLLPYTDSRQRIIRNTSRLTITSTRRLPLPLAALLFMVLLVVVGIVAFTLWSRGQAAGRRVEPSPADLLRERYARGEITREQYRQTLLDLLQDRYARHEISLDELEARVKRLISE